jgi:hypothetical protein
MFPLKSKLPALMPLTSNKKRPVARPAHNLFHSKKCLLKSHRASTGYGSKRFQRDWTGSQGIRIVAMTVQRKQQSRPQKIEHPAKNV